MYSIFYRICSVLLAVFLLPLTAGAADNTVFRLGVAPHTSARVILEMYQPVRGALAQALGRPVEVVTAPDFTEFARRALRGDYDIAVTTGHQARLLESDAGFTSLVTYAADFRAVALVSKNSTYQTANDLAGTTVFGLSPSSLVTIWGQHWLQRNGVADVQVKYVSAADSVARLVLNREGSAAFTSLANYQALAPEVRDDLRILDESLPMAGRVYMLNPRQADVREKIVQALLEFATTAEAKAYFTRYKLVGYKRLAPRELVEMEPYANEIRQVLKQQTR